MTVPLLYVEADPGQSAPAESRRLAIVASKGGEPDHPAWYLNVLANPDVEVHLGAELMPAVALPATTEEHERVWPRLVQQYRYFADYTHRARREGGREIPVVLLDLDRSQARQWRRSNM
jgi:deazaflavin-dependent oxidoreductase (nitroreductase family)